METQITYLQGNLTSLSDSLTSTNGSLGGVTEGLNTVYLVLSAALVFIMHGGFAMVSGYVYVDQSIIRMCTELIHFRSSALEPSGEWRVRNT